jgi:predicted nucleic acid-binding protein
MSAARELMLGFNYCDIAGRDVALRAAQLYRPLRRQGITVRKTIDILIGSFCITINSCLLHDDRDFPSVPTSASCHQYDRATPVDAHIA